MQTQKKNPLIKPIAKFKKTPKVAFVGLTHLGLVTSICWASFKVNILALDKNLSLINNLKANNIDTAEPDLKDLYHKVKKFYYPTTNFSLLQDIKLIFITLDTPTDKPSSLKSLNDFIDETIPYLTDNTTLTIMSQVPVGYCRRLYKKIKTKRPNLKFKLYYFLNTLIIGNAISHFLTPEKVVIGKYLEDEPLSKDFNLELKGFNAPVIQMSYESAEMTKTAVNLFLAASITAANTLSDFCEVTGANIYQINNALRLDKRIGKYAYLKPTLRIAGGHLERELIKLKSLSKKKRVSDGIASSITYLNNQRISWLKNKIKKIIRSNNFKPNITIWGLTYKKGTNSLDNAPSLKIIKSFHKKANIKVYDPIAKIPPTNKQLRRYNDKYQALNRSDCLIILTDWEEFEQVNLPKMEKLMKTKKIIDCVGVLYSFKKTLGNFDYSCMGVS